jgi:hypothetical protein
MKTFSEAKNSPSGLFDRSFSQGCDDHRHGALVLDVSRRRRHRPETISIELAVSSVRWRIAAPLNSILSGGVVNHKHRHNDHPRDDHSHEHENSTGQRGPSTFARDAPTPLDPLPVEAVKSFQSSPKISMCLSKFAGRRLVARS